MSATFVWACDQKPGDPLAKNILFVLSSFANWDTGECFPSLSRIAEIAECSRRTVIRKLEQLEKAGFITIKPRKAGSSNFITLKGYLEWRKDSKNQGKKIGKTTEESGDTQSLVTDSHQCHTDTRVVTHSHQGSDTQSPITSNRTSNLTNNSFAENKKEMERELSGLSNEEPRVEIRENKIFLCKPLKEEWLSLFNNNEQDLDLALVQIFPYLQNRNPVQLEVQVNSQLSRICRERRERDARYASSTKKEKKPFTPSRWGINYD